MTAATIMRGRGEQMREQRWLKSFPTDHTNARHSLISVLYCFPVLTQRSLAPQARHHEHSR